MFTIRRILTDVFTSHPTSNLFWHKKFSNIHPAWSDSDKHGALCGSTHRRQQSIIFGIVNTQKVKIS